MAAARRRLRALRDRAAALAGGRAGTLALRVARRGRRGAVDQAGVHLPAVSAAPRRRCSSGWCFTVGNPGGRHGAEQASTGSRRRHRHRHASAAQGRLRPHVGSMGDAGASARLRA
jgi:hypothetical protein